MIPESGTLMMQSFFFHRWEMNLILLGFTWLYWILLSYTGFYLVLLGFTGFSGKKKKEKSQVFLDFT